MMEPEEVGEVLAPLNYPSVLLRGIHYAMRERKDAPTTKFISAVRGLRMVLRRKMREEVDKWLEENFGRLLEKYREETSDEQQAVVRAYEDYLSEIVDVIDDSGLLYFRPRRQVGGIW
jgi:hypothetical protein